MEQEGHGARLRGRGITLLELTVCLALTVGLTVWAGMAWRTVLADWQMEVSMRALGLSMTLARNEAIQRNGRVVLCKSATGLWCSDAGDWSQGWIVFHDANNNAWRDPGEPLLRAEPRLPDRLSLSGNSPVASYISFASDGAVRRHTGAFQAGTLTLCNRGSGARKEQRLVINANGRFRRSKSQPAAC